MNKFRLPLYFIAVLIVAVLLIAATPAQQAAEESTWRGVFTIVLLAVIGTIGSSVTQVLKNALSKVLDTDIAGRVALLLSMLVAGAFAVLELWLDGVIDFSEITTATFPNVFFAVYTVMNVYYGLFKESSSFFGEGLLLRK